MKYIFIFLLGTSFSGNAQNDTLRLLFVGDIMNNQAMIDAACIEKNKKYDYNPNFRYIKPLIESADLAIGNLELTMPGQPPFTGFPHFRSPDVVADALKNAGFDILVGANNHANDSGAKGVQHSIEVLDKKKILHTGTFKNKAEREAYYPLVVYKNGFKIALLNYTHHTNGIATQSPVIVNRINIEQIKHDLSTARALSPDFIIVFLHWGNEYELRENTSQRRLAKFLVRHGADLVIGAHPHVVQPIRRETATLDNGKRKEALVAYSLGNFISNMNKPNTDGGIVFRVNLVKEHDKPGATVQDYGFMPVWRYIQKSKSGRNTYYVLPVAKLERNPALVPGMSKRSRAAMLAFAAGLRKRLVCIERKY